MAIPTASHYLKLVLDSNFGATAGVAEMLIQSYMSYIDLLPSLPDALENGYDSGLCAQGAFELSSKWKNGALRKH